MTNHRSKYKMSADSKKNIEAAMQKISASGLKERFAQQDRTGAYEAELAMEHSNFARPQINHDKEETE